MRPNPLLAEEATETGHDGAVMRRIIASLLLIIGFTGAAGAYDNPKALVEAIYQPYSVGEKHADGLEKFYSARLKDLYAANVERQGVDQKGAAVDPDAPDMLAFDPFIEGAELAAARCGDQRAGAERRPRRVHGELSATSTT